MRACMCGSRSNPMPQRSNPHIRRLDPSLAIKKTNTPTHMQTTKHTPAPRQHAAGVVQHRRRHRASRPGQRRAGLPQQPPPPAPPRLAQPVRRGELHPLHDLLEKALWPQAQSTGRWGAGWTRVADASSSVSGTVVPSSMLTTTSSVLALASAGAAMCFVCVCKQAGALHEGRRGLPAV